MLTIFEDDELDVMELPNGMTIKMNIFGMYVLHSIILNINIT